MLSDFIQKHERLIIVCLVLGFGVYIVDRIDNRIATQDAAAISAAQQQLSAAQANAQNAAQAALQAQQALQAAQTAYQAQVAALNARLAQDEANLAAQQKVDSTLPPTALVQRWNQLLPTVSPTVTPTGVTLSEDGAVTTVQALEQVPVLQNDLKIENDLRDAAQKDNEACQVANSALAAEVTNDAKLLDATKKADAAELKKAKFVALKTKLHWLAGGYVAGWVSALVVLVK